MDAEVVANFAFEVHTCYHDRRSMPATSQAWVERIRRRVDQTVRQALAGPAPTPPVPPVIIEDRIPAPLTREAVVAEYGNAQHASGGGNGTSAQRTMDTNTGDQPRSKRGATAQWSYPGLMDRFDCYIPVNSNSRGLT